MIKTIQMTPPYPYLKPEQRRRSGKTEKRNGIRRLDNLLGR